MSERERFIEEHWKLFGEAYSQSEDDLPTCYPIEKDARYWIGVLYDKGFRYSKETKDNETP